MEKLCPTNSTVSWWVLDTQQLLLQHLVPVITWKHIVAVIALAALMVLLLYLLFDRIVNFLKFVLWFLIWCVPWCLGVVSILRTEQIRNLILNYIL